MGGSKTDPGIFINWSLRLGTTASTCITFDKFWPISRDLVFDIRTLELWVVNEVLMKKRNVPKRDFYSTVVMWNRLGKHKANVKEREYMLEDNRESYFHNCNFRNNSRNCSPVEVHETEQRHFEPSHTSLPGINPLDDELLLAIKNRLAGVPPMPGALSLKPEASGERFNVEYAKPNKPPPYVVTSEPNKPKKVPTPVATQVDDSMITELKHQGTSTSHVKVTSTFTQSTLTQRVDGATQSQHSSRTNRDEAFQRSSHLEQNTQTSNTGSAQCSSQMEQNTIVPQRRQYSCRMHRVDEEFQQSSHLEPNTYNPERTPSKINQMDEGDKRSLQTRPNSLPNHARQSVQYQVVPSAHHDPSTDRIIGNVQQSHPQPGLPEVPHFYQQRPSVSSGLPSETSGRPSATRSMRSNQEDLAGSGNQHNMKEVSTVQQYQGPQAKPVPQSQPLSDGAVGEAHPTRGIGSNESPRNSRPRVTMDPSYGRPSIFSIQTAQPQSQPQPPNSALGESHSNPYHPRGNGSDESHRNSTARAMTDPSYGRQSIFSNQTAQPSSVMPPSPPGEQTVLAMTTKQISNCQMCRCGSRELNLACFCKKSAIKEVECARLLEEKECRCTNADSDGLSTKGKKKKKKEKKGKPDKETKAEEKRRKKEEKERQKREKKEQRAKEKESRKSKCKDKKSKTTKGKKSTGLMCSCCKCHGGGETTMVPSETSLSQTSEEKCKRRTKKEKKPKEKKEKKLKEKNNKKTKECDERPFRPCECPPERKPYDNYNSSSRMAATPGCCNHPESPCPALVKRGLGEFSSSYMAVPMTSSKDNCGDPVCPQGRNTVRRSCTCSPTRTRDLCVERTEPCGRVCANVALIEQDGYQGYQGTDLRSLSRSRNPGATRTSSGSGNTSPPRASTGDAREDGMRYRDVTAAPAMILPSDTGRGDAAEALPFPGRWLSDQRLPSASGYNTNDVLIDLSKRGRENSANKRYVPPCVLYLDCTKVKDLCVIIKDKYEDPS